MWEPPPQGVLKFNVDGSVRDKPGPAGCGCVLRDYLGIVLALFSSPLDVMESNEAELFTIRAVLVFYAASQWQEWPLVIESDSRIVVAWILRCDRRPWLHWLCFNQIDEASLHITHFCFHDVLRDGNAIVDSLAKGGVTRSSPTPASPDSHDGIYIVTKLKECPSRPTPVESQFPGLSDRKKGNTGKPILTIPEPPTLRSKPPNQYPLFLNHKNRA
ncbi:hypothetical protein GQ457_13G012470 [Hibiscus cannabinus]